MRAHAGSLVAVAFVAALVGPGFASLLPDVRPTHVLVMALGTGLLFYLSIFLHELGHAVAAVRLRVPVQQISLTLIGGGTHLAEEAPTARGQFLVSAAGPAVSLGLGFLGLGFLGLGFAGLGAVDQPTVAGVLLVQLTAANLGVGAFNLLPGLPLDGGRLLSAAVWAASGRRALGLGVAGWSGRGIAVGIVPVWLALGRVEGPLDWCGVAFLGLFAVFMWAGATQALRAASVYHRLPRLNARVLARRADSVVGEVPLAEALRHLKDSGAGALVVVDRADRPVGIVSEAAVAATPPDQRPWISVSDAARRVHPEEWIPWSLVGLPLVDALAAQGTVAEWVVVDDLGRVFGVLTWADVERVWKA